MVSKYWFKSAQFKLQDGEEEQTNPDCFGKSLAEWLSTEFSKLGYETEVIPEDWGWCVMCERNDFLLWIGCGSMITTEVNEGDTDSLPDVNDIVWHVFTEIEIPFFMLKSHMKKLLGQLDLSSPVNKLNKEINAVLCSNESISFCEEP